MVRYISVHENDKHQIQDNGWRGERLGGQEGNTEASTDILSISDILFVKLDGG